LEATVGHTPASSVGLAQIAPAGYIEMNPADVQGLGLKEGGKVALTSDLGQTVGPLKVSEAVPQGLVFAPYHFADVNIQQLVPAGQNTVAVKASMA
jgi:formate dehydrogenase alpha subunit